MQNPFMNQNGRGPVPNQSYYGGAGTHDPRSLGYYQNSLSTPGTARYTSQANTTHAQAHNVASQQQRALTPFNAAAPPFIPSLAPLSSPSLFTRPSNARIFGFMEASELAAINAANATQEDKPPSEYHSALYLVSQRPLREHETLFQMQKWHPVADRMRRNNIVGGFVSQDGSKTPEPDVVWEEPVEETKKTKGKGEKKKRRKRAGKKNRSRGGGSAGGT